MLRRILKALGATLAAAVLLALGAIVLFLLTFEPNDYRGLMEDTVSAALERQVRLDGDIELVPALIPTLAVNDVSIANPSWASRPTMATAGRLEATIALRPLLDGRVEITHAALERVDALLERRQDGRGNWEFALAADTDTDEASGQAIETSVDQIELIDITARYVEADGTDITTHVDVLTLERSAAGQVSIRATGRLQALPVTAEWLAGPLSDTDPSSELQWPVTATVSLGDTTATMTGRLAAPMAYERSDFDLRVVGRNASQILELLGLSTAANLDYDLQGRVRIEPDSVQVADLRGSLSGGEVFRATGIDSGSLRLARGQRVEAALAGTASGVPFSVSTRLGLLRDILRASPAWPLDAEAVLGEATLSASGTASIGETDTSADLSVLASGPLLESLNRLRPFGLPELGPLGLETMLVAETDQVALRDLHLAIAGSGIEGDLTVTGLAATPAVSGNLIVSSLDIGRFALAGAPAETPNLPDRELPLDWLGAINASLTLELGELRGLPISLTDLALRLDLADGTLDIAEASARLATVELRGRGSLAQAAGKAAVALEILAEPTDSASLMPALGINAISGLAWSAGPAALRLDTQGSSARELVEASRLDLTTDAAALEYARDSRNANVGLSALAISAEPSRPVMLTAIGNLTADAWSETIDTPFELALTAGKLGELLGEQRLWPAIEMTLSGARFKEQVLQLHTQVADTAALMSELEAPLVLNASWGPLAAHIDATLVPTASLTGTTGDLSLTTDDLAATAALLGLQGIPAGEASLSGHVAIDQNTVELSDFAASLPGIDAGGVLNVRRADRLEGSADIHFAMLDLTSYVPPGDSVPTPDTRSRPLAVHDLLSDTPIALPRLREADVGADLRAAVDEFRLGDFVSRDGAAHLRLERGNLQVEASLDAGRVIASAEIDARDQAVDLRLSLAGEAVPLAVDQTAAPAAETVVMDVDATVAGHGLSTRAIAASLDGEIEIYLTSGRIRARGLRFLFGSVLYQLFDVINPFTQRQDFVEIECVGAYFDVADGVLTTRNGIIMQTPELQAVGVGGVNLADDSLQMRFQTKRRKGIVPSIGGIVNEFVELSGTFDAPAIQVSARRAARSGLVAIATGGLSLIATDVFGRLTAGDVCEDLRARVSALETADD